MGGMDIAVVAFVVVVILVLFAGIKTVPQGYRYTVERFGRYTRTMEPGLNLIVPFIDRIGSKLSVMEQVLDVPTQEVITKDNASVSADASPSIRSERRTGGLSGRQSGNALLNLTMTNIPLRHGLNGSGRTPVEPRHDQRSIAPVVDEAPNPWGIKITRIEIKDIRAAERPGRRHGPADEGGTREAPQVLGSGGLQKCADPACRRREAIGDPQAEGQREAAYREAEARERLAEAEAKATRMVSEAIAAGDVQAINYFVAQKYTEALAAIERRSNQKIVLMPMEASSLIGSLGGIGAIAKRSSVKAPASLPRQRQSRPEPVLPFPRKRPEDRP